MASSASAPAPIPLQPPEPPPWTTVAAVTFTSQEAL